ncbi:creatininase family protein [Falsiroseomonas sp. CW058]|uniref:creatininase family protein n=1 Tax=Falsiroseomonas sp. CW058 TaxID=3388664 RepID=UPI003D31A46E
MAWLELAEMTTLEFAAAKPRLALLPVGATEQHGPNLNMATDTVIAHRVAQRIAEAMGPVAVVLPPLPFGLSQHHMGFAGTVTFSERTFLDACADVARSMKAHGVTHLLLVNGHNGNTQALGVAASRILYEVGMQAAVAFYFQQAADRVKAHGRTPRFGHACEVETSVALAVAPELVRRDALAPGEMVALDLPLGTNEQPFFLQVPIPFDRQTRNGVFGDARLANAEAGEDIIGTAVARTVTFLHAFLAR